MFNNFGKFNAKEEAARRAENLRILEESSPPAKSFIEADFAAVELEVLGKPASVENLTVEIKDNKGFFSADCPNCGKTKILSGELNSLSAVCNQCYCPFNLEK